MKSVTQYGYNYMEVVTGSATQRGNIMSNPTSNMLYDLYGEPDNVNCFNSVFMFDDGIVEHVEKTGSVANYRGNVGIDYLYWDFDSDNVNSALTDARELRFRLMEFGCNPENIHTFFSGNKGFHVVLYCTDIHHLFGKDNLPAIVKSICYNMASDLESFDQKIYDKTRIFRTINSKHPKSGLYKIQVSMDETLETVKEHAIRQQPTHIERFDDTSVPKIVQMINEADKQSTGRYKMSRSNFTADELLEGMTNGFSHGKRNSGLASLAGLLHRRDIKKDFISAILHSVNGKCDVPLLDNEVDTIIASVDRYPIDPDFVDPKADHIIGFGEAAENYIALRKRVDKMQYGFEHLDKQIPFFDPGDVMLICARAGVGKTTFGMQMNNNMAKHCNGYGLFASLEMAKHFIFLRAACIEANREGEALSTFDVSKLVMQGNELVNKTKQAWERLLILDRDSLSLEQIEQYYMIAKENHPNMTNLMVDYGGLIRGGDNYEGISKIARGLKGLAKRLETRLTVVVQLSRAAGDGTQPVKMDHLRDTGAWEEGADYIYGGWISKNDSKRIHMSCLKNRWLEGRNNVFDLINEGLCYTSVDYVADTGSEGGW